MANQPSMPKRKAHPMLRRTLFVFFLSLFVGCGGSDSVGTISQEQISAGNELASLLEGKTDTASLETVKPQMKKLWERLQSAEKRMKALPPSAENGVEFQKHKADVTKMVGRLFKAAMTIRREHPEASSVLLDVGIIRETKFGDFVGGAVYDVTYPPTAPDKAK